MFLRCERCRAVYELETGLSTRPVVVSCLRCSHVFAARALTELAHVGQLGGAAAENRASPDALPEGAPLPLAVAVQTSAPVEPPPKSVERNEFDLGRSRVPMVAGLLLFAAVLGVAAALLLPRLRRANRPEMPAPAAEKIAEGRALLWKDDEVSIERAVAAFSDAAALAPDHAEARAWHGLGAVLLGDTLQAEIEDLNEEAGWIEQRMRIVREIKPKETEAQLTLLEARLGDVRARLNVIEPRAGELLEEGRRLVLGAYAAEGMDDQLDTVRAAAVLHATARDPLRIDEIVRALREAERADPWILYARGRARLTPGLAGQAARDVQTALESAKASQEGFVRATWQLGRLALLKRPYDVEQAETQLGEIALESPDHEGADRGMRRISDLRLPLPVPADMEPTAAVP